MWSEGITKEETVGQTHRAMFAFVKLTPTDLLFTTLDRLYYPLFDFDTDKYGV